MICSDIATTAWHLCLQTDVQYECQGSKVFHKLNKKVNLIKLLSSSNQCFTGVTFLLLGEMFLNILLLGHIC